MSSEWSTEQVFSNSPDFFNQMIIDIGAAKQSLHLEYYIFEYDELGKRLVELLIAKAKAGVSVKLLVDGVGSLNWISKYILDAAPESIELRIYHPAPWPLPRFLVSSHFSLQKITRAFSWINRRDHKKLCVIDGKIAFVGSMNVHKETLNWRECGARISGEEVKLLEKNYQASWENSRAPKDFTKLTVNLPSTNHLPVSALIRLNHTKANRRTYRKQLVKKILSCQDRVWMTVAYFAPPPSVYRALKKAAQSGKDVRLVVAGKTDIAYTRWLGRFFYRPLVKAGVKIFQYQPQVLHAKTVLIDDWCLVGSSNINYRSFYYDLELDVVLTKPESIRNLADFFEDNFRNSKFIDNSEVEKVYWRHIIQERLALLLKRWS